MTADVNAAEIASELVAGCADVDVSEYPKVFLFSPISVVMKMNCSSGDRE